jgi:6-phosphogluconate dehydrogenase
MQLGIIGLGKMGANMAARLMAAGHEVIGFDLNEEAVADLVVAGGGGAASVGDLVSQLDAPRAVWIMVPHGPPVDATLDLLLVGATRGDIVIDGGNSYYRDTMRRGAQCAENGMHFVDVGTSGGIWGISEGYSMMIGGGDEPVERLRPIFEALAPSPDRGWGHVGPSGAGHYVKMIHNGIEYGMMQAYAEGFAIMHAKEEFGFDLGQIGDIWEHGSVIRSWLLELTTLALKDRPEMEGIAAYVPDSGEGRWTVFESIDLNVPAPIIGLSLLRRIGSRDEVEYADRLLAALRNQFGGHAVAQEP